MKRTLLFFGLLLLAACSQAPVAPTPGVSAQQLGTRADDAVTSVAVDTKLGAVYVIGATDGSLDGPNRGHSDVMLRRYNRSGDVVWKRQFGSSGYDGAGNVVADNQGFMYATYALDAPGGAENKLEKLRSNGTSVWSRTLETKTAYGKEPISVSALAAGQDGSVYVGGALYETMYVFKYSGSGSLLWTRSVDGNGIFFYPTGIDTDASGNVYVSANEMDDCCLANVLLKFNSGGKQLFKKAVAAEENVLELTGLQVHGDALYLAGTKHYNWAGDYDKKSDADGFVARYSLSGTRVWQKGFGTASTDAVNGLSVDQGGNVYVTGYTYGALGGAHPGGSDIFLRKVSSRGDALWTKQIGSKGDDSGFAVAVYGNNEVYLAGHAGGALKGSTYHGGQDGFLRRTDGSGNRVWTDQ